jgi:hypothetical protein
MSTTCSTPRTPARTTPLREKMRADLQLAGLSERTQGIGNPNALSAAFGTTGGW